MNDENSSVTPEEPAPAENAGTAEKKPSAGWAADAFDWLEIFVFALSVVFLVFLFIGRVAVVDGTSMLNTLENGQGLIVQEAFYTPQAGEIVVCQSANYHFKPLVKRIIAKAGDTVSLDCENWKVYVNGVALDEPYVFYRSDAEMHGWNYGDTITVPEGCVFVMGDNRNGSTDSRSPIIGMIDERLVLGKVIFRYSPLSAFGTVS